MLSFKIMRGPIGKVERNNQAFELRLAGYTYGQIAAQLGVTRQRIQALLSPPKVVRDEVVQRAGGICEKCGLIVGKSGHVHHQGNNGREDYNDLPNLHLLCITCHRAIHRKPKPDKPKIAPEVVEQLVVTKPIREEIVLVIQGVEYLPSDLVSVQQAAKELNCYRATIYRWLQKGRIKGIEIAGTQFVYKSEIERIKKETESSPNRPKKSPRR